MAGGTSAAKLVAGTTQLFLGVAVTSGSSQSGSTQASGGAGHAARSLLHLSKSDLEIQVLKNRIQDIEQQQRAAQQELAERRSAVLQADALLEAQAVKQGEEEERLRVEQRKIVERRKHLSSIGGTRGAKLMEREIDISTRTVQQMEQKVLQMLEETDQVKSRAAKLRAELDAKQLEVETGAAAVAGTLEECRTRLAALEGRRAEAVETLEERVRGLYVRISGKYPGGAIAVAEAGACRSCYRSLPAQMFNQVTSGSLLLQCPGCSRILIPAGLVAEVEGSSEKSV